MKYLNNKVLHTCKENSQYTLEELNADVESFLLRVAELETSVENVVEARPVNKIRRVASHNKKLGETKSFIQISNDIVRNNGFELTCKDFAFIALLKYYLYLNGENPQLELDHIRLLQHLNIRDNRTFLKMLASLKASDIILESVTKLPIRSSLHLTINSERIFNGKGFTRLPTRLKNYFSELGHTGYRLIYYYESYINRREAQKDYAFPSFQTIGKDLQLSEHTVHKFNKILVKHGMLKIKKFGLWENASGMVKRYNNHYTPLIENM